VTDNRKQQLQQ